MSLKSKKKHIKTVTQKVKLFRAKDPLMSVFMWGVNHTVSDVRMMLSVFENSTM